VHGGALALLFDSLLGFTAVKLGNSFYQRTAYLHVNYRQIVPVEREVRIDATLDGTEGRKMFVSGRLLDGDTVLCEAEALFVKLKPGQP
jgi:acyl-coenzyme A thioesterase PaaI-like protein